MEFENLHKNVPMKTFDIHVHVLCIVGVYRTFLNEFKNNSTNTVSVYSTLESEFIEY